MWLSILNCQCPLGTGGVKMEPPTSAIVFWAPWDVPVMASCEMPMSRVPSGQELSRYGGETKA